MDTKTLTKEGAKRIGAPELAGKQVQCDDYMLLDGVEGYMKVYYKGERICGVLTTDGDKPSLK